MAEAQDAELQAASDRIFARVVVGVDGSGPSFEAALQAKRLVDPGESLVLVAARRGGTARAEQAAVEALRAAAAIVGSCAKTEVVSGPVGRALRGVLEAREATVVAVGTHGPDGSPEGGLGSLARELLREAPCSVLLARRPEVGARFPRALAVGIDGSAEAAVVLAVARGLALRLDVPLRIVAATGGGEIDEARVHAQAPDAELVEGAAVGVLVECSSDADLLLVGLGGPAERVAAAARCSVLVVR